jgi:hypothetical protein
MVKVAPIERYMLILDVIRSPGEPFAGNTFTYVMYDGDAPGFTETCDQREKLQDRLWKSHGFRPACVTLRVLGPL